MRPSPFGPGNGTELPDVISWNGRWLSESSILTSKERISSILEGKVRADSDSGIVVVACE